MNGTIQAYCDLEEIENWRRIRAAIEHENTLVNHRLTWLLGSQTILFAGFGVVFAVDDGKRWSSDLSTLILLTAISFVAIVISVNIRRQINLAAKQLAHLDAWWHAQSNDERQFIEKADEDSLHATRRLRLTSHPPLQLREPQSFWLDELIRIENVFIICWLLVFAFVLFEPLCRSLDISLTRFGRIQDPFNSFKLVFSIVAIILVPKLLKHDFDSRSSRSSR